ncbi:MAG: hypothetical protein EOP08_12795 [Proteobacteria bacterium]|nr:MAG: hypothetical protein EOP08_12795 [Pseudomonadota bacterium]
MALDGDGASALPEGERAVDLLVAFITGLLRLALRHGLDVVRPKLRVAGDHREECIDGSVGILARH